MDSSMHSHGQMTAKDTHASQPGLLDRRIYFPVVSARQSTYPERNAALRLVRSAARRRVPFAPLLEAWAWDEDRAQRVRLQWIKRHLDDGMTLPDAAERVPSVFGDDGTLALRFSAQTGIVDSTLKQQIEEPPLLTDAARLGFRKLMQYAQIVLPLAFVILLFQQVKIVPELRKISDEFAMDFPRWSEPFYALNEWMVAYGWLWIVLLLAIAFMLSLAWPGRFFRQALLGRFLGSVRRWRVAQVLSLLGVANEGGRPLAGAVSTLARYHFDPWIRNRLLFVRNELEQGVSLWQSLTTVKFLSPPEAKSLDLADQLGNQAWVLQHLADARRHASRQRIEKIAGWSHIVFVLLAALVVFCQAVPTIAWLAHIVFYLA